jgi:hypothetical protein
MPLTFTCPDCKGLNTFEDSWAGMRAPCQRCGSYLAVPAQSTYIAAQPSGDVPPPKAATHKIAEGPPPQRAVPPPLPESSGTDLPGRSARQKDDYWGARDDDDDDRRGPYGISLGRPYGVAPGWNTVRIGLGMMFWGTIAIIVLAVCAAAFMFLILGLAFGGRGGFGGRNADALGALGIVLVGFLLVTALIVFVGQCMCIAVPPESRARGLAIGSVVGIVATILLYLVFLFFMFATVRNVNQFGGGGFGFGGPEILILMFALVIAVVGVSSHVMFILFLKAVARYFRNESLAQSTSGYLTLFFVAVGLSVVLQCLGAMARDPQMGMVMLFAGLIVLGLQIALVVWYLVLLARTRAAIGS